MTTIMPTITSLEQNRQVLPPTGINHVFSDLFPIHQDCSSLVKSFDALSLDENVSNIRKILISASSCVPTFKPDFKSINLKKAYSRVPTDYSIDINL